MARVWLVLRRGGCWVAPGGTPAFELPLADLIFPLDIGIHRRVTDDPPVPLRDMPPVPPEELHKVLVEVEPKDLAALEFTGYSPGVYDSPYSPQAAIRRLAGQRNPTARASA